jgi:hypothetical protein
MLPLLLLCLVSADWQPLPPVGSSSIKSLYGIGDTLVACGATSCALALDQGERWVAPVNHVPFEGVPNHSGATFVAPAQKMMRSTDMGRTWSVWSDGFPTGLTPEAVALQGSRAFLSAYKMRQKAGLSIIEDTCVWFVRDGESSTQWTRLDSAMTSYCSGIAIGHDGTLLRSGRKVDSLFASTLLVESSTDLGRTWTPVRTGAYVKQYHDGTLALNDILGDSSLLSLDSGRTWKRSGYVYTEYYLDGAILAEGSEDWQDLRTGATRTFDLDSLGKVTSWARTGRILWAQGNWGLFSSSDSGKTWKRSDRNCPMSSTPSLRWHDGALYANTFQGKRYILARSTDAGKSWKQLTQASRGIGRLESCGDKLMAEEYDGTLVVSGESASVLGVSQSVGAISCLGPNAFGLADGELVRWSGANWSNFGSVAFKDPMELAATPEGVFARIDDWDNDDMRVDFIADGSSVVETANVPAYVKSIAGSARGAWIATVRGLYRCTDAQHCTAENPQGADSLWAFSALTVQGPFVLASAIRYGNDLQYDYGQIKLFASGDSGKSWTTFPAPFAIHAAAVTPAGIVASLYGVGLYLIPSDTFRVTGVAPFHPARGFAPSIRAHGRILSLTGISAGARLRILDASGRVILDIRPEVRDGRASAVLPAGASGILFASLESAGKTSSFRWVQSGR